VGGIEYELRLAEPDDRPFVIEMARAACTLEGRPFPPADDPEVIALVPKSQDAAIVASETNGRLLGAAWWFTHEPPLTRDANGEPLPELAMAVIEEERGKGVGGALIEALAEHAAEHFPALTLNVHLLNPAVRLYTRTGFRVAGAGRGRFGVAMIRSLGA
jgi:GNAT superfamily N-acetyltransferase